MHPFPVGDCARNPTAAAPGPSVKYRSRSHHDPSRDAWNAQAEPLRVTRSHSGAPSATGKELQSSDSDRVTTVTAVGTSCGEYSKHSLAQHRSDTQTSSTPASYMLANPTATRADRVKSPRGGVPRNRPASGGPAAAAPTAAAPAGSMNRSVPPAAVSSSAPRSTRHPGAGLPDGSRGNGNPGIFKATTRVVCHVGSTPGE